MIDKLIEYLEGRIEELEKEKQNYLDAMEKTYTEKGIYREYYFKALEKKIEVQDILLKVYELKKCDSNV